MENAVKGYFQSKNVGYILSNWDITQVLSKGKGSATFSLNWQNAPNRLKMKNLSGNFYFNFKDGRILEIGNDANTNEVSLGRLLNIFSVRSLLQHITLNFTDLTAKGLKYNTLKGKFSLKQGIATTNDAYLDGPIAKIKVKGKVNFLAKYYDLHLSVSPYVTSSVPMVIAILGGPVAGAVAWVVNKIVSPEIGKAFGSTYDVKASWDKSKTAKLPPPTTTKKQA